MTLQELERVFAGRRPRRVWRLFQPRHAAVAVILRPGPDVLLTVRATRAGDRWSGHVAFPGGMRQRGDATSLDTAIRETHEEVGVELGRSRYLGAMDQVRAVVHGGLYPMAITPHVFAARGHLAPTPSPEVTHTFWLPLDLAASGALDSRLWYPRGRFRVPFPCWRYHDQIIWGLTYGMLKSMLLLVNKAHFAV